jgi:fructokinase
MPDKPLILALGEILWDLLPAGKQLGGAPANFAYHASQLGGDARIVSAVGQDDLGREMLDLLHARGLDSAQVVIDGEHPTGTVSVSLRDGHPDYQIHEGVAWDFVPTSAALLELAAGADAVCFGTLAQRSAVTRQTIGAVLAAVRPNTVRVFDVNLRQHYYDRAIIETLLGATDVLKLNDQELPIVGKLLDFGGPVHERMFANYPRLSLIAVTRGAGGSILYSPNCSFEHAGHLVPNLVDTIGAGDAFTAALTIGLLRRQNVNLINDRANRLAAHVCTHPGATPPIPPALLAELTGSGVQPTHE